MEAGIGEMDVRGTELVGVDALAFRPGEDWTWFTVPNGPAHVVAFFHRQDIAYHKAAIVFSEMAPVCGAQVGLMHIDNGIGAFLDRRSADALRQYGEAMDAGCDLYSCLIVKQVPNQIVAQILRLPDGTSYPAVSTGYGDGDYPIFMLRDADGAPTAAYVDFTGVAGMNEWQAPPACPKLQS